MARRTVWITLMTCVVMVDAAAAQPRELPRVAIADFEVTPSGSTLPAPHLGVTLRRRSLRGLRVSSPHP